MAAIVMAFSSASAFTPRSQVSNQETVRCPCASSLVSSPLQKARPSPLTITTRASALCARWAVAVTRSSTQARLAALSTAGRLSRSRAIGPLASQRIVSSSRVDIALPPVSARASSHGQVLVAMYNLLQSQSLYCPFAQDKLLHFATGRHGIGVHELEIAWDLLMADLPLTELTQLLLRNYCSLSGTHHRKQLLTKESIRYSYDVHLSNFGMPQQELFDLAWEDVLAAANDHLFEATHDVEVALRIHRCQVPRVQPTLAINRCPGLRWHLVVADHDLVAPTAQFPTLSARHNIACRWIDQLNLAMRQR